jgi:uncharacterized protein (DUF952 family)
MLLTVAPHGPCCDLLETIVHIFLRRDPGGQFTLGAVDLNDGFIHMSTAKQVPGVLKRVFADVDSVAILRLEYGKLSAFKRVTWDNASNGEGE